MRMKIKCTIVLLSIFSGLSLTAQDKKSTEPEKKETITYQKEGPLKGLRKLGDDEMADQQIMVDGESFPIYNSKWERVRGEELNKFFMTGEYGMDLYVDKDQEIKAGVFRPATEEEKKMMQGGMPEEMSMEEYSQAETAGGEDATPKNIVYETQGPLKGLRKLTEDEMYLMQNKLNQFYGPFYNTEGEKIGDEQLDKALMSGEYFMDFYVDKGKEIKAGSLRPATAQEKEMMIGMEGDMTDGSLEGEANFTPKEAIPFSVQDMEGNEYSLNSLKGKVIVMNFWFIGCKPCMQEIPELNELVEKYHGKEVVFLGFASDKKSRLEKFLKKKTFKYNIIPGSKIDGSYKVFGYPTHVVIDQNSQIVWRTTGLSSMTVSTLDQEIEKLIAQ